VIRQQIFNVDQRHAPVIFPLVASRDIHNGLDHVVYFSIHFPRDKSLWVDKYQAHRNCCRKIFL